MALGLHRDQVAGVHGTYLAGLATAAWADGVVTDEERSELERVATDLGLSRSLVSVALATAQRRFGPSTARALGAFTLLPGDRVVFTGEMEVSRGVWEARSVAAGLALGGMARATKVLVAADPDSASGKAAKARALGVPIITERAFAGLLADLENR